MEHTLRVVICEDHELVRQGIVLLLASESDIEVVGEAGDGFDAVALCRRLQPDVVLMDLCMPNMGGLEAIREIRARQPGVRLLVLTVANSEQRVAESLRAGADGYAMKTAGRADLIAAIRAVAAGRRYLGEGISRSRVERLLRDGGEQSTPLELLTPRERQVFRLIAQGLRNREVAEKLFISLKTVETHRANIMQKLDLHSAVELATYAVKEGLLEPD